jgi:5-dehydro-2-deoxygluconokinase
VRGFAIGRNIFWSAAEAWFAGQFGDDAVIAQVAENYRKRISMWRRRRTAI